ncbi:RNA polymerase sigma factor (sigma-70 family) [Actinomadura pelletieri DSM 43383]|uniref:RNA polymerase sigma factor (Sigma-70 family) n=1 Tax=Actinomadura pelletieri DSM 43383 TaxID=1120940 RepID=A0A495QFY2_9ACTN|nr:RNA polymerase sigma factor [Actinomadura pelletieri]RKS70673.1 RNA polymerase sigma factor (sigma-70 family) [Actinomadura pelletieri DSM 43383]
MAAPAGPDEDPERIRQVDREIEVFQQQRGDGFYRLARSQGLCHDDALGILQDSLLALRKRLISKGPVKNQLGYFCTIVKHQIIDHSRRVARLGETPLDITTLDSSASGSLDVIPQANTAKPRLPAKQAMLEAATQAFDELPGHLREVYELAVFAQLEPAEIAQTLGKRPATVRSHLSNARGQVQRRAEELLHARKDPPRMERESKGGDGDE